MTLKNLFHSFRIVHVTPMFAWRDQYEVIANLQMSLARVVDDLGTDIKFCWADLAEYDFDEECQKILKRNHKRFSRLAGRILINTPVFFLSY